MNKLKFLLVAIFCFSFVLCTDALSMEDITEKDYLGKNCTHWGLKHWVYGIKEYTIDRCLCCARGGFNPIDEDRAYRNDEENVTTDCCCVMYSGCDCVFNNPIGGTLCFPLAMVTHLLCLPRACCSPRKRVFDMKEEEEEEKLTTYKYKTSNYSVTPYSNDDDSWSSSLKTSMSQIDADREAIYNPSSPQYKEAMFKNMMQTTAYINATTYNNPLSPLYTGIKY